MVVPNRIHSGKAARERPISRHVLPVSRRVGECAHASWRAAAAGLVVLFEEADLVQRERKDDGHADEERPEVWVAVLPFVLGRVLKVGAVHAGDEGDGQEDNADDCQRLGGHALPVRGEVEDERDEIAALVGQPEEHLGRSVGVVDRVVEVHRRQAGQHAVVLRVAAHDVGDERVAGRDHAAHLRQLALLRVDDRGASCCRLPAHHLPLVLIQDVVVLVRYGPQVVHDDIDDAVH
mmetsp:Transcript_20120/g.50637  ORF Transcript_20120/g.50637 Transcript_20120/m.50637 type:complete len:235 (+) Transcript_20120:88-792(+)